MRPLQLKMHHFGPFLDETIDFSRLGHELFLITGPTGSGKTTIFDGMCYALYGEGSNSFRQSREMKSQFGDPLETMWVEFVFTLKNKTYKIRRIPEQERRRARGEGTALQKHEAAFYEIAGEEERLISASVEEIRSLVPQLLGINASQFRQIIMLPQGEFSRLLKAPVDERVELLKSIFRMDLYQKLREKMGARLKAAREQCSLLGTQIASEREHVAAEDHQILAQALAEGVDTAYLLTLMTTAIDEDTALLQGLSEDDADLQKRIQGAQTLLAAAKQINARFDSLKAYKDKQAKLDEQAGEMDQLEKWLAAAEAALRVRPVEETLIAVQQKLLAAQREVSEIEGQWSELADRAEGLRAEAARVTAQDFERSLENLRRLSEVRAQMMEKWQLWDEKRLAQSRQAERITALAQRWEGVRTAAQALEGQRECCQDNEKQRLALVEEGRGLSWEIKTQGEMLDKLAEITEGFDKIAEMEKVIGQLRESFRRARQDAQKKQAVLDEAKVNHRAHLAATLAEKLSEGAPCPVCGSVHHPQKPLPPENFVDDAAQKALEDEAQK
ncbi:MAG: SMC family ATPase, partial [Eubacterium sp.]|nr:SMC family ATPase [Eubacterium sp.]